MNNGFLCVLVTLLCNKKFKNIQTPWVATANIGSIVRFFDSNNDPPPTTGTVGSPKSPGDHKQSSCYTDDGQAVQVILFLFVKYTCSLLVFRFLMLCVLFFLFQCTESCAVIGTSIIGADGVNVNWGFSNDTNDAGGLVAVGPPTMVSLDPSNPLGKYGPSGQPNCQPTVRCTLFIKRTHDIEDTGLIVFTIFDNY